MGLTSPRAPQWGLCRPLVDLEYRDDLTLTPNIAGGPRHDRIHQ
jgi:hypothetical protein